MCDPWKKGRKNTVPISHDRSHAGLHVLKGNENIRSIVQASYSQEPPPAKIYNARVCAPNDCLHKTTLMWEMPGLQMAADTGSFVDGGVKGILEIYSRIMVDTCLTLVGVVCVLCGPVIWGFIQTYGK